MFRNVGKFSPTISSWLHSRKNRTHSRIIPGGRLMMLHEPGAINRRLKLTNPARVSRICYINRTKFMGFSLHLRSYKSVRFSLRLCSMEYKITNLTRDLTATTINEKSLGDFSRVLSRLSVLMTCWGNLRSYKLLYKLLGSSNSNIEINNFLLSFITTITRVFVVFL